MIKKSDKIFIAGHTGLVGSAILRKLKTEGYLNLLTITSKDLDLRVQQDVDDFLRVERPSLIVNAAAKVGGILANSKFPYEFLLDNMLVQNNLIHSAHKYDVQKFIFLGSSCIYPKYAPQPLKEDYLLTGPLEKTNEWYAVAKISGVKLIEALRLEYCRDYVSLMPSNLYGPNDNFDLNTSHVLPAMIRKFHDAKISGNPQVVLWGSGLPLREFLHVDDLANVVHFSIENTLENHLYNVGTGCDLTIKNLANIIQNIVGYKGDIQWDTSKPDGTPRKLMDVSRIKLKGWSPKISLEEGVKDTYDWFLKEYF